MLISNMEPVQEAYFGKSKYLLEGEEVLKKIIKRFKVPFEQRGKRIIDAVAVNKSSENKKLEELIKKQFGFGEVCIHWDGSNTVNAFSFSRGIIRLITTDMPKLPVKQSDGGYYDEGHNYICAIGIYAGLIDEGLTAEELMATILHEIGHNFQCTPITNFATVTDLVVVPVNAYFAIKNFIKTRDSKNEINEITTTLKDLKASGAGKTLPKSERDAIAANLVKAAFAFLGYANRTLEHLGRTKDTFLKAIYTQFAPDIFKDYFKALDLWILENKNKILANYKAYIERYKQQKKIIESDKDRFYSWDIVRGKAWDLIMMIINGGPATIMDIYDVQTGYSGEVFADSFATAYGYGPATVSSQMKFNKLRLRASQYGLNKGNKHTIYNQYVFLMCNALNAIMDPHPSDQTRIKNQINKLRSELKNDDIPPEMKKIIAKDLDEAEATYDKFLSLSPEFRHLTIISAYYNINETYFGGKLEIRDILNRVLNFGKAEA